VERDRLIAADMVESARELGLRTVVVDGSGTVDDLAALVADHFAPFLPPARPNLEERLRETMDRLRDGDHEATLRLALEGREQFPDRPEIWWFWVIAALNASGRTEEALTTLEEAVSRDLAWRFGLYSSPGLSPILETLRFQAAMERSRERLARFGARPLVRVWEPPATPSGDRPMALLLHGANASLTQFAAAAPDLAAAGWLATCCQASQPTSPTTFCWDDRERADADVDAFCELAGEHDSRRVVAVGYSQGGGIAVRAALRGRAPLGFVALSAAFGPPILKSTAELARAAAPVKGVILTGDRDPWVETAREAHRILIEAGHDVNLQIIPGRGHALAPEMTLLLAELLARLS
jgi:dienelactone hydrolase